MKFLNFLIHIEIWNKYLDSYQPHATTKRPSPAPAVSLGMANYETAEVDKLHTV